MQRGEVSACVWALARARARSLAREGSPQRQRGLLLEGMHNAHVRVHVHVHVICGLCVGGLTKSSVRLWQFASLALSSSRACRATTPLLGCAIGGKQVAVPAGNRRTSPPHPGLAQWTGPTANLPTLPRLLQLAAQLCSLCFESRGPLALADGELALGRQRRLGLAAQLCLRALRGPASGKAGAQLHKLCVLARRTRGAWSSAGRAPSQEAEC